MDSSLHRFIGFRLWFPSQHSLNKPSNFSGQVHFNIHGDPMFSVCLARDRDDRSYPLRARHRWVCRHGRRYYPRRRFHFVSSHLRWTCFWFRKYLYRPQRSCGKVILSQACVKNSVRGGVCLGARWDTPPGQTPPAPPGRFPLDRHLPTRRLLQRMVRILLECILVLFACVLYRAYY